MVSTTTIIWTVLSYQILQLSVWSRLNGYHDHQTLLHNQILQLSTHTVWSCLHGFDYHHNMNCVILSDTANFHTHSTIILKWLLITKHCYIIRYYNFLHNHAYMVSTTTIIRTMLSYQILQLSVWSRLNGYHDQQTLLHNQILQLSTHTVWSCLHGFNYRHDMNCVILSDIPTFLTHSIHTHAYGQNT